MKYFCTYEQLDFDENSTNYLEFYWGPHDPDHTWRKDSLYIAGDVFDHVCGMKLLLRSGALPEFDFYDDTVVTREDWQRMRTILAAQSGNAADFAEELASWISDGFSCHDCFVISGV